MSVWGKPLLINSGQGASASGNPAMFVGNGADLSALTIAIPIAQTGSGTPAPDNIMPITTWTGAVVTVQGPEVADLRTITSSWLSEAGKVAIGSADIVGGTVTPARVYLELDGTEGWAFVAKSGSGYPYVRYQLPETTWAGTSATMACSHLNPGVSIASSNKTLGIRVALGSDSKPYMSIRKTSSDTLASVTAWLAEQKAAGTPVQVAYSIEAAKRVPIACTPYAVKSYWGQNSVSANCGAVTLTLPARSMIYMS